MASSVALPLLAARGSNGVQLIQGQDSFKVLQDLFSEEEAKGKVMCFSDDGSLFAYTTGQELKIMDMNDGSTIFKVPKQKTISLKFSPKNTYLACWEPFYTSPHFPNGINNYEIYNIKTGEAVKSVMYKKQSGWEPKWTCDEVISSRCVSNEVQFYEKEDFHTAAHKLYLQGVEDFSISPSSSPYMVAAYIAGKKGAPSCVRLFQYPNFENGQAITNKSFFKADKVDMFWNNKGNGLLVLVSAEVDTSGSTYYGEQSLHFLSTKGESSLVPFDKRGPVYNVEWNPNSSHFCVVFGFMPAKATLFNMKAEPIFDFGTGPRSICSFNSHGNILCLAGFGNLPGMMELWNVDGRKLITKAQARDSTFFQWCPDGQHFLTATCAPRLRVGNGYKIWHYTGKEVAKYEVPKNTELFEAIWQNQPPGTFPIPKITTNAVQEVKQQAYRPPSARGTPQKKLTLHEDELPQNQRNQPMSASALKNKKKREAKAKAKQNEQQSSVTNSTTLISPVTTKTTESDSTGDPDIDKKIKGLKKKLRQIEDLKNKQREGKQLEKNQLDKIGTEKNILKELEALQVS